MTSDPSDFDTSDTPTDKGIGAVNDYAEVPNCLWVPADPTNYTLRPQAQERVYDLVVIHITSGHADPHGTAEMFQKPHAGKSSHFVVGQDATTLQCVSLRFAAYHAHNVNSRSVGIEHSAREPNEFYDGDPGMPPTEVQLERSAWLAAYLLKAAGLPVQRGVTIEGHNKVDTRTNHDGCPDAAPWPWTQYMLMVQEQWNALPEGILIG